MLEGSRSRAARSSLTRKVALRVVLSTALALTVFGVVALAVVVVQEQLEPDPDPPEVILREARSEVGEAMAIAAPVGMLLAAAGAYGATRRALQPLEAVIKEAARIGARDLGMRLPLPAEHDEVRATVVAFNDLLGRLEAGFAALDQFAAGASHELRTPLAVMAMELEVMLQRQRTSHEWESCARVCLDEVRRLGELVAALLDVARAKPRSHASESSCELRVLVERVLVGAAARVRAGGLQLAAALDEHGTRVIGVDCDTLLCAVMNVVDNAVRYTEPGGEVWLSARALGQESLLLCVDDTGPGIAPHERQRIFEPFSRGVSARTTATGFGLGLAIARRICEHNQVMLTVEDSPRGGARFSFTLPSAPKLSQLGTNTPQGKSACSTDSGSP